MGAIADAVVAYTQPLLDATDGSLEGANRALTIGQLCWNLSLMPEDARDESLVGTQQALEMDDDEFGEFRRSVIEPMVRRHEEMFPRMHQRSGGVHSFEDLLDDFVDDSYDPSVPQSRPVMPPPPMAHRAGKFPGTGRNDPCPCNSGRKYKRCCGR